MFVWRPNTPTFIRLVFTRVRAFGTRRATFRVAGRGIFRTESPLSIKSFYDNDRNLTQSVDFDGQTIDYAYDDLDQQISEAWVVPDSTPSNIIESAYDADGRLIGQAETSNPSTPSAALVSMNDYVYDNLGDVDQQLTYDGTDAMWTGVFSDFNAAGQQTEVDVADNVVSLSPLYSESSSVFYVGTVPGNLVRISGVSNLSYTYDYDGQVSEIQFVNGNGGIVNPLFGTADDLDVDLAPMKVSIAYRPDGQVESETRNYGGLFATSAPTTGAITSNSYDAAGLITSQITTQGGATLVAYNFSSYDHDNRLLSETYTTQYDLTGSGTYSYSYAPAGDLLNASNPVTTSQAYTYDANGGVTSQSGSTVYPGLNNQVEYDGTYFYYYDNNGDMIEQAGNGATISYTYDYHNMLTEVTEQSGSGASALTTSAIFTYNPAGNRISASADKEPGRRPQGNFGILLVAPSVADPNAAIILLLHRLHSSALSDDGPPKVVISTYLRQAQSRPILAA